MSDAEAGGRRMTTWNGPFARLAREAGWTYYAVAVIGRLPFAMAVVGVVGFLVISTGSYELSGWCSALIGVGAAVGGPLLGRAVDRWGQRRVLLPYVAVYVAALLCLIWLVTIDAPEAGVLATAAVIGLASPQVSPMSRTRLAAMAEQTLPRSQITPATRTMLGVESFIDEITFVIGPAAVGVVSLTFGTAVPIIAAAALTAVAGVAFACHPTARFVRGSAMLPRVGEKRASWGWAHPRILVLALSLLAIGGFFGSTLIDVTRFTGASGVPHLAGLIYAGTGVGSALFALLVTFLPDRLSLEVRAIVFATITAAAAIAIAFVTTLPAMAITLAIAGAGIGPLLVTNFSTANARSNAEDRTTVMTLLGAGLILGQSLGSAIAGALVQANVPFGAAAVAGTSALLLLALSLANFTLFRPRAAFA
jgi:MFS family permease